MTALSGAGVRVLLIATSTHQGSTLPSVPSAARGLRDLSTVLVERCGVRTECLKLLIDPPDARSMAQAVSEAAGEADSVLFVYFIGHGLLSFDEELYLASCETDRLTPGMAEHQALSFTALRQAVSASRAASVIIALDCCFSGRPLRGGTRVPAFTMEPAHGEYFLGSAEQLALARPDAEHTAFTGALIHTLTKGDPRAPHTLTLEAVYDAVFRRLRAQQQPLPRRLAGDRAGNLVLAPNPAAIPPEPALEDFEPKTDRCPYAGLDSFTVDDSELFFGRDAMTALLVEKVSAAEGGPVIVVGPSGSGKTSLLNAGLLPHLRGEGQGNGAQSALPGAAAWPCIRLTPGEHPLRRLDTQLVAPVPGSTALSEDSNLIHGIVDQLLDELPGGRLILLVDQLEELFTMCQDPFERTAFLRTINMLAHPREGERLPRVVVVCALRADFYGQAAAHPELVAALRDRQLLIEPMNADELRAVIELPALRAGLALDDGLPDLILHEMGALGQGQPAAGVLPLLSHVLWETWRHSPGSRLTVAGYRQRGGIEKAIAQSADAEYKALDEAGRLCLRRMLPQLVHVSEVTADTAQAVDRSALLHGLPDPAAGSEVLTRLTRARLLTLDRDTVRLSHEALLRAWEDLRTWVEADRDWLRARQQLTADAAVWEQSGQDSSLLYRGTRLAAFRETAEQSPGGSTAELAPGSAAEFIAASRRHDRLAKRLRNSAVALLAVLAVLATSGLIGVNVYYKEAQRAEKRQLARYLAAEAEGLRTLHPGLAKQLSLISYRTDHDAGRNALLNSQRTPGMINDGEPAYDLESSTRNGLIAFSTGDSIVLRAGGAVGRIPVTLSGPMAVNRDGHTLTAAVATAATPTTLRSWDITDPAHPRPLATLAPDAAVSSLTYSADGSMLFAGTATGEILRWDTHDPASPKPSTAMRGHTKRVDSLAASPHRDLLASISTDGRLRLWDLRSTAQPPKATATLHAATYTPSTTSNDHPQSPQRVAFDPSGTLLAAPPGESKGKGDADFGDGVNLALWKIDAARSPRRVMVAGDSEDSSGTATCAGSGITHLVFNPKDKEIATGCRSSWQLWIYKFGPEALLPGASLENFSEEASSGVLFDPSNTRRLLRASDHGVQVWDVSNGVSPGAAGFVPARPYPGAQLDLAKSGKRLLLALQGVGNNQLWDLDMPHKIARRLLSSPAPRLFISQDIALSADGTLLAALDVTRRTQSGYYVDLNLRDTSRPQVPTASIDVDNGVAALAFSPTASILAVSDLNGAIADNHKTPKVSLYDVADPHHPRLLKQLITTAFGLDFSPDGTTLVINEGSLKKTRLSNSARIRGWAVDDPRHPKVRWTVKLPSGTNFGRFAYRPDGKLFALSDESGTLRLWPVRNQHLTSTPTQLTLGGSHFSNLAFSPDGNRLAFTAKSDSDDGEERPEVWNVSNPASPTRQYYLPSGNFHDLAFTPDGKYLAVVRRFAGVDLWDLKTSHLNADLCNAIGDPITKNQWRKYLPDRPYQPPCPSA
ncbi:caspase family protein [Streptomyces sp. 372A]|uniref:caspase, EACC1-associated type n=1 Tax=Streptomyces sp. SAS_281 TaxID=3412744 RepID=UPI00403CCAE4